MVKVWQNLHFQSDKMATHNQGVDQLHKGYLYWTWFYIIHETLVSCPDTTITVISLGKEVNEVFENA